MPCRATRCMPSPAECFKFIVDTNVAVESGIIELGCVIRNNMGEVIGAIVDKITKLFVIWFGLKFSLDIRLHVLLE